MQWQEYRLRTLGAGALQPTLFVAAGGTFILFLASLRKDGYRESDGPATDCHISAYHQDPRRPKIGGQEFRSDST